MGFRFIDLPRWKSSYGIYLFLVKFSTPVITFATPVITFTTPVITIATPGITFVTPDITIATPDITFSGFHVRSSVFDDRRSVRNDRSCVRNAPTCVRKSPTCVLNLRTSVWNLPEIVLIKHALIVSMIYYVFAMHSFFMFSQHNAIENHPESISVLIRFFFYMIFFSIVEWLNNFQRTVSHKKNFYAFNRLPGTFDI